MSHHSQADSQEPTLDHQRIFYLPAMPSEAIVESVRQIVDRFDLRSDRSLALRH